jgi:hypothetical protein
MKVTGPDSGAGLVPPDGGTETEATGNAPVGPARGGETAASEASGIQPTEGSGRAFAETLAAIEAGGAGSTVAAATMPPTAGGRATAAIAGDVDAGRLTPAAAVERVLEQVLTQQLGSDAPAGVRDRVRAALQEALETDPLLAEKLRRLGS